MSEPETAPKPPKLLECDVVMKGGITSGVVYPLAIVKLSETYKFCSIGGTSAGAIAAAATAAAELGRGKPNAGFKLLEDLPDWLAQKASNKVTSNLMALFQPQPRTARLFRILMAGLQPGIKLLNLGLAALVVHWKSAIVGAIPGIATMLLMRPTSTLEILVSELLGVFVLLVGVILALVIRLYFSVTHDLPANNFGLCNGYLPTKGVVSRDPALTQWLHEYLNQLAGRDAAGEPLTFADLQAKNIDLLMMTTNLTQGLPHRLPFETRLYFYDPKDFAVLFPPVVMTYLERKNQEYEKAGSTPVKLSHNEPLWRFPKGNDLPVVVAVRMSLSFPVLLSAIPLYAFHKTQKEAAPTPKRSWFSDGGITSNFPVHFFDSPLPSRPTFAINLMPFEDDEPVTDDPEKAVWMPNTNGAGISTIRTVFDGGSSGAGQLFGFFAAIFNSAQNWVDSSQALMPGYRDRIAHVKLHASEGGLNLSMDSEMIKQLTKRGQVAGEMLVDRFKKDSTATLNWQNHRWVRYRATMASLEMYLLKFHEKYTRAPQNGDPSYQDLIERGNGKPPKGYSLYVDPNIPKDERTFALETTKDLIETLERWKSRHAKYKAQFASEKAPHPRAELRAQPGGREQPSRTSDEFTRESGNSEDL